MGEEEAKNQGLLLEIQGEFNTLGSLMEVNTNRSIYNDRTFKVPVKLVLC